MSTPDGTRSVRIGDDERGGWSSDRPRRDGKMPEERGPQVAVRCRVLPPSDRQRYTPGSLVVIVTAGDPASLERFADVRIEETKAILSMARMRQLIAGRVDEAQVEATAATLLDKTVEKRLAAGNSTVVLLEDLTPESRNRFVVPAAKVRKARHLIFVDAPKEQVAEEDRDTVNALRRAVDGAGLGEEGFMTVLRLGGSAIHELNRIVFRPPPSDD